MTRDNAADRKAALSRLVADFADANLATVYSECDSIRSLSILYALVNPQRPNTPNDAQMAEVAVFARKLAAHITACAEGIEALCIPKRRTCADHHGAEDCDASHQLIDTP